MRYQIYTTPLCQSNRDMVSYDFSGYSDVGVYVCMCICMHISDLRTIPG